MSVTFEAIPSGIRRPGIYSEFNLAMAGVGLPPRNDKIVLLAQRTSDGSKAALETYKVFSAAEVAAGSGSGSIAHFAATAMYEANPYIDVTVIGIDDASSGVAATGTITIGGPATGNGIAAINVGNETVSVSYENEDTATDVATKLKDMLNIKVLPVTATSAEGVITLTARNKGTCGNYIRLGAETTGNGITAAVTSAMASGDGDPDYSAEDGVLDALFAGDFTVYVSALTDKTNLQALRDHLDQISNGVEMRPAVGVFGYTDLVGDMASVETLCGEDLNAWRMSCAYLPNSKSSPWEIAGAYAAVLVSEDHPNAVWNDLVLAGINAPDVSGRLSAMMQEELLNNGVTPLRVVPGEQVAIVRAITTHITNSQGIPDAVRLDLSKPRALDYVRSACRNRVSLKFVRIRKTEENRQLLIDEILDVLYLLEAEEVVRDTEHWKDYLTVEDDTVDDTRWNVKCPAAIVPGLHVLAIRIDLL